MKMRSKMQNEKGFTLVELMVVVVILGILVAIAVPVYNSVTKKAEYSAIQANLRTIDGAIMAYGANHDGAIPTSGNLTASGSAYLQEWPDKPGTYTIDATNGVANVQVTAGMGGIATAGTYSLKSLPAPE